MQFFIYIFSNNYFLNRNNCCQRDCFSFCTDRAEPDHLIIPLDKLPCIRGRVSILFSGIFGHLNNALFSDFSLIEDGKKNNLKNDILVISGIAQLLKLNVFSFFFSSFLPFYDDALKNFGRYFLFVFYFSFLVDKEQVSLTGAAQSAVKM